MNTIIQIDPKQNWLSSLISGIKGYCSEMKDKLKANERDRRKSQIMASFAVEEHRGELYIMHNGEPLCRLAPQTSVSMIIGSLRKYREDALHYENLKP